MSKCGFGVDYTASTSLQPITLSLSLSRFCKGVEGSSAPPPKTSARPCWALPIGPSHRDTALFDSNSTALCLSLCALPDSKELPSHRRLCCTYASFYAKGSTCRNFIKNMFILERLLQSQHGLAWPPALAIVPAPGGDLTGFSTLGLKLIIVVSMFFSIPSFPW